MSDVPVSPLAFLQLAAEDGRWAIINELARSDRRVRELTAATGRAQNLVSYHLGELRRAGLVSARRSSADGRDSYYRLELGRFGELLGSVGAAVHPALAAGRAPAAPAVARAPVVLFLCTGNSARSQMAEALLEHRSAGAVKARSAGSHPKALHPNAVRVMAERGIDIAHRPTKHLRRYSRSRFDQVITLCDKVREICPEFRTRRPGAHWSMADPSTAASGGDEATYPAFRRCADEIDERVGLLIRELLHTTNERNRRAC